MNKGIFFSILFFIFLSSIVIAQNNETHKVPVYFFYREDCPHCAAAKPFLRDLEEKYPEIEVKAYEVVSNKSNLELFFSMSAACGIKVNAVPTIFIGHKPLIGFDSAERKGKEIEKQVQKCIKEGCVDLMDHLGMNLTSCPAAEEERKVNLPIFGTIDTTKISLPIFTIMIGLLDGFNPCSMWVLLFLLALLIYTGSRKKMLFVGGLFIFVSAAGYFIFMTAWLNFFLYVGFFSWMRILVGLGAVIVGIINIKEMFFFKKGPSLTIADKHKARLVKKMHYLIHEATIPSILVGIASLALTVNFFEFLCTAGFPAIFTKVLTMNNLPSIQYYLYILLYIIMYELDDLVVLGAALIFFSKRPLTKEQGKWLKFIAGLMMLVLGLLLIIKPDLLMFG